MFKGKLEDVDKLNLCVRSLVEGGPNKYVLQVTKVTCDCKSLFFEDVVKEYDNIALISLCNMKALHLPKDVQLLHLKLFQDLTCLEDISLLESMTDLRKCLVESCDGRNR